MNKFFFILSTILVLATYSSEAQQKIYTSDIDNFWVAYDSIGKTNQLSDKIRIINELYINKGTRGLKAFMEARQYNDSLWVQLIAKYPKFWNSIRPNTLSVKGKINDLEKAIDSLKKIYPELKEAEMYFTIGGLRSGGTLKDNMVLIGAEIATGGPATDVSEFKNDWLKNVFKEQSADNIISLNIHEYIHTQQKDGNAIVLNQCIREGSCDFIAERTLQRPLQRKYLSYGKANALHLKELFKKEMFSDNFSNWLYNGNEKGESADLGYYMGYEICKAYYEQAKDKKQAIKEIIELDYSNDKAVEHFISKSKFYKEKINKKQLTSEYSKNQPFIVAMTPFKNGDQDVDPNLKELKIAFSKDMMPDQYSLNYSEKGKDHYPIKKLRFENNNTTMVLEISLQPNKEYEFVIVKGGFRSKDGYSLKDKGSGLVKFKTKLP